MARRNGGIITLGVLGIIFGLMSLFWNGGLFGSILVFKYSAVKLNAAAKEVLQKANVFILASLLINALTALMIFIAGIGLFSLKGWARWLYAAAAMITVVNRLAAFPLHFASFRLNPQSPDVASQVGGFVGGIMGDVGVIALNVFIFWWLSRTSVKALFQPAVEDSKEFPCP